MDRYIHTAAVILIVLGFPSTEVHLFTRQPVAVPRDSAQIVINGKRISIDYGRPSIRGRKIMGEFVPYNKVWRTGAGKATTLVTEADLELGGMEIPRGTYSLFTLPSEAGWKLIINKQTGQWGTVHNPQQDLARINLDKQRLANPVEKLTFSFERTANYSGLLKIEWEVTALSLPFRVSPVPIIASPRDSVELILNGKRIAVNYGRPSARGRRIMGSVVPYDSVWRTGANMSTLLSTQADLVIAGITVPRGNYSLYTIPSRTSWRLIINRETGQSGLVYHRKLDLTRVKMQKRSTATYVERFTILLNKASDVSGTMVLEWERTSVSVPFKLKHP